jgi:hypothetical protein
LARICFVELRRRSHTFGAAGSQTHAKFPDRLKPEGGPRPDP